MIPTVLEIPSKDNPYDPNKVQICCLIFFFKPKYGAYMCPHTAIYVCPDALRVMYRAWNPRKKEERTTAMTHTRTHTCPQN